MSKLHFGAMSVAAIMLSAAPELAWSQGASQDILGTDEPPVIIEDRPAREEVDETRIRREDEAIVQIRGAWAAEPSACASVDEGGGGLYVTDTLIRWENSSCSIREIDSEGNAATVRALCATESERRDRTFRFEVSGEDELTVSFFAGDQEHEVSLQRCEGKQ